MNEQQAEDVLYYLLWAFLLIMSACCLCTILATLYGKWRALQ